MSAATKSRPRTKLPEVRRKELMVAAQRLFIKQGVGATTIEQITLEADVAKGTFYLYFSSKEDVLAALERQFEEELIATIRASVGKRSKEDWRGRLGTWATAAATGYLDSIQLHDIVFHGRPQTRESRKGMVDNVIIDDLCELLQEGEAAGAWTVEDPKFTAVFLFNGLHGAADEVYSKRKQIKRSQMTKGLEQLFFGAVGLVPGSSR
jgi:AcrR family transcriptional regulator